MTAIFGESIQKQIPVHAAPILSAITASLLLPPCSIIVEAVCSLA
jgi:hypothetical protein